MWLTLSREPVHSAACSPLVAEPGVHVREPAMESNSVIEIPLEPSCHLAAFPFGLRNVKDTSEAT
jgi:hypothetical protein